MLPRIDISKMKSKRMSIRRGSTTKLMASTTAIP
jgi:hypothetical protein